MVGFLTIAIRHAAALLAGVVVLLSGTAGTADRLDAGRLAAVIAIEAEADSGRVPVDERAAPPEKSELPPLSFRGGQPQSIPAAKLEEGGPRLEIIPRKDRAVAPVGQPGITSQAAIRPPDSAGEPRVLPGLFAQVLYCVWRN